MVRSGVDVSLTRRDIKIACEISVTTGRDREFANLEKCLAAGYTHLVFISKDSRHIKAMDKLARNHFEEDERAKVHFVSPEDALALIGSWVGDAPATTIRDYEVNTTTAPISEEEAHRRRNAIASVIAKSLLTEKREK